VTTLFYTTTALTSLRADVNSDRFSDGFRRFYPAGRPITRLRKVGDQGGRFYYAAADDLTAVLPAVAHVVIAPAVAAPASIATGGRLGGRQL
jgi:hypothetical protein